MVAARAGASIASLLICAVITSCQAVQAGERSAPTPSATSSQSAPTEPATVTPIRSSTATASPTRLPDPTAPPRPVEGRITLSPYPYGDAGRLFPQAGETTTLIWEQAPADADRYEFYFMDSDTETRSLLGVDQHAADGVSVEWSVPERVSGAIEAVAVHPDGGRVFSGRSGRIHSGDAAPEGVCSISSTTIGAVHILVKPDWMTGREVAYLAPGAYAKVLGRTEDDWYLVDTATSDLAMPELEDSDRGWVSQDHMDFRFHGPCDDLPLMEP